MTDITSEELFDLIKLAASAGDGGSEEKENLRPEVHHGSTGNHIAGYHGDDTVRASKATNDTNNNSKLQLIVIDARPFHSLGDVLQSSSPQTIPSNHGDNLGDVSLTGSMRVHYPNLLRKRSKGKMMLENVIVDKNARSLVANHPLPSPSLHPPIHETTPRHPCIVVYDQNTSSVSSLPEDCDAKQALKVLLLSCSEDVKVFFLAGGLERFHNLYPHLCTPAHANEPHGKEVNTDENRDKQMERCFHFNTADDKSVVDDLPCQLLPWLFLGSQSHAINRPSLDRLGITALLNVAAQQPPPTYPIRSAPVGKSSNNSTRFPFAPIPTSNFRTPKVPFNEPMTYSGAHKEHKYRRMTRKGIYFKQYLDQSQRGTQTSGHKSANELQVLNIPIADNLDTEISLWFDQCNSFIEKIRSDSERVLVHCHAGISRSATICLAYLIWSQTSNSLNEAFDFVRSKRSIVAPNFSFMRQLEEYETSLVSGRRQYRHSTDLFLRSIQTPLSLPDGLSLQDDLGLVDSSDRQTIRFTFDRTGRDEDRHNDNNTRGVLIKRSFSFAENREDQSSAMLFPFDRANKIVANVFADNKQSKYGKILKQHHPSTSQQRDNRFLQRVNKYLSSDNILSSPQSTKKDSESTPANILANDQAMISYSRVFETRQCQKFISKLCRRLGDNVLYPRHHPRVVAKKILCHQHFRCRNKFTNNNHHHHNHQSHCRRPHTIKCGRSYNKLIHSEILFDDDNDDASGDDNDLYAPLKLILILVMAIAIVYLVEKRHVV